MEEALRMSSDKLAFVVATKDRPKKLERMLRSLDNQTRRPDQIVVVDGSQNSCQKITQEFPRLAVSYDTFSPPSATKQRNYGITRVRKDISLVGFLDDDEKLAAMAAAFVCSI